ncbi:TniB family NTP-binding protein, partial [Methylobacterium goesingense]|uniref:TniB family NTP-binding protein n=1 Tax=Methylobacterium goesingense TaxID=243690 RepID=UPI001EE1E638
GTDLVVVADDEIRSVVHVTLSAKATIKTLGSDILEEYEDPEFEEGTATKLLRRAANHIEKAKTDLLILDEVHHLIDNDKGGTVAMSVAETIKRMLIRGACPVVLVGTEQAMPLITKNVQLQGRAYNPVIARPLDLATKTGLAEFRDHCVGFDLMLVRHRIFRKPSGLVVGDVPAFAYDVSGGIIGLASRLFEIASEKAMVRGGDRIEDRDLSSAVEDWAIPLGITDHNPWTHGRKPLKSKKAGT